MAKVSWPPISLIKHALKFLKQDFLGAIFDPFLFEISKVGSRIIFWIFLFPIFSILSDIFFCCCCCCSIHCVCLLFNSFTIAQKCIAIVPFQASYSECSWPPVLVCYHNGIPYFPWPGYVKGISFSSSRLNSNNWPSSWAGLARPLKFLSRPPLGLRV